TGRVRRSLRRRTGRRGRRSAPRRALSVRAARGRAEGSLRRFRQATILSVGLTGFLLLLLAPEQATGAQAAGNGAGAAAAEAPGPPRGLLYGFGASLPRYGIALGLLLVAGVLVRVVRVVLPLALRNWERSNAFTALAGVVIWLLA